MGRDGHHRGVPLAEVDHVFQGYQRGQKLVEGEDAPEGLKIEKAAIIKEPPPELAGKTPEDLVGPILQKEQAPAGGTGVVEPLGRLGPAAGQAVIGQPRPGLGDEVGPKVGRSLF
jgi:hypothetical protein